MNLVEKIMEISKEVNSLDKENPSIKLPRNSYYLKNGDVVCFEREYGDSRYAYDAGGLMVWAKSSGYIEVFDAPFFVFKNYVTCDDATFGFWGGIPMEDGNFFPVSVLNTSKALYEPIDVTRYVVYSIRAAYYIAETQDFIFAVRLHVDKEKHIHFTYTTINKSEKSSKLYMASFMEPLLAFSQYQDAWSRLHRKAKVEGNSYLISNSDNHLVVNRIEDGVAPYAKYHAVKKGVFLGANGRQIANAESLKNGKFFQNDKGVYAIDFPIASDILHYDLEKGQYACIEYDLSYHYNMEDAEKQFGKIRDIKEIEQALSEMTNEEQTEFDTLKIKFDDWKYNVNPNVLNNFINNVKKQVSACSLAKTYAGYNGAGIRDIYQQLETNLIWQPEKSREKLIYYLNCIAENGRPARQWQMKPINDDNKLVLNTFQYIDQGNWIISAIYTYLAYTDDYSILNETCGYFKPTEIEDWNVLVEISSITDSVLDHLIKITDYLTSNIADDTNCLRILRGDWNDSLNGLGKTDDEGKKYGTSVSVMASTHLYQNYREMIAILKKIGGYEDKIAEYEQCKEKLKNGLLKYAVDVNASGERKVIHGWGDKYSYKVASWNDPDGKSRTSAAANSFWAITEMIYEDPSLKSSLVDAFNRLDSKYGLRTFDVPFTKEYIKYFGGIAGMVPGIFENAASYVHASIFSIMALLMLGQGDYGWKQLEKAAVITHDDCSLTSFIMPNSYNHNEEQGLDGESFGDWYTGSGTTFIKSILKYGLGIEPDLEGLKLHMTSQMPCNNALVDIKVKGSNIKIKYSNKNNGKRTYIVDGKEYDTVYDDIMGCENAYIKDLHDGMVIEVID